MIGIYHKSCYKVPLIINYLKDNDESDTQLFTSYLITFYMDYYNTSCLSIDGILYIHQSIIHSLKDRFLANYSFLKLQVSIHIG